jgi:hypothetical protein
VGDALSHAIFDVWGTSASDVWAAGLSATVLHYDGTRWSQISTSPTISSTTDLSAVWASSADDVWVTSFSGNIFHYSLSGGTWVSLFSTTGSTSLADVNGTSSGDVWAVGTGGVVVHWNGTAWSALAAGIPATQDLNAVRPISATNAWAFGADGNIYQYNGTTWSLKASPVPATDSLFFPWVIGAGDIYAPVAHFTGGTPVFDSAGIVHFDGSGWSALTLPAAAAAQGLFGIWASSATDVWGVGGAGLIVHGDVTAGFTLTSAPTGPGGKADLNAVWGSGAHDIWALGGVILHGTP